MVTRDRASTAILTPGRTCWRLDRAGRFRCIQDGADYFRFVRDAILKARHTIFILGWDISGRVNLLPGHEHAGEPVHLDELLAAASLHQHAPSTLTEHHVVQQPRGNQ